MSEKALLDTNVLIHALDPDSQFFPASSALLEQTADPSARLCVTPQVLAEFYAIVTDRRRVSAPRAAEETLTAITALLERPGLELLPIPTDVVSRWMALVRRRPVVGPDLYDLQLIATMLGNGVRRIYTYNAQDFTPFAELEVLIPGVTAAAAATPDTGEPGS